MLRDRVFVTLDDIYVINEFFIFAAGFSGNLTVQCIGGSSSFSSMRFFNSRYKSNVPLLTTDEIFSPEYGLGGNNVNHPNPLGVEYIYGMALKGATSQLSAYFRDNNGVKKITYPVLASGLSGAITATRLGNAIYVNAVNLQGDFSAGTVIATLDVLFFPLSKLITTAQKDGVQDEAIPISISADGKISIIMAMVSTSGRYGFSVSYARTS